MKTQNPPPVIASARVVAFVRLDGSVLPREPLPLTNPAAQVSGIALCEPLDAGANGFFLAFCDEHWAMLDNLPTVSPSLALLTLSRSYPDIRACWQDTTVTIHQALAWLASQGDTHSTGH